VDLTLDAHEREVASAARSLLGQIITTETLRSVEDAQSAEAVRKVLLGIGSGGWLAGPEREGKTCSAGCPSSPRRGAALAPAWSRWRSGRGQCWPACAATPPYGRR